MQTPENIPQFAAPSLDAARETPPDAAAQSANQPGDASIAAPQNANTQGAASTRAPHNDPAPVTFEDVTPQESAPPPEQHFTAVTPVQTVAPDAEITATPQSAAPPVAAPPTATTQSAPAQSANAVVENLAPENVRQLPSALFPGAFLGGEYEIKTVLSRGLTNLYEAQRGDYGDTTACLIAEREIVAPIATAQAATAPNVAMQQSVQAESAASTRGADATNLAAATSTTSSFVTSVSADEAAGSGAFIEDVDTLPTSALPAATAPANATANAPVISPPATATAPDAAASTRVVSAGAGAESSVQSGLAANGLDVETSAAPPASTGEIALQSALFPPHKQFAQDEREYLVFDHFASESLQDHREATNDERALSMLISLAKGLAELEAKNLHAIFSTDTLRVDEHGDLRFLGFVGPASGAETSSYVKQLRDCTSFILKRVFAESSTMSLEDEFGALVFSVELKEVARKISSGEYSRVSQAAQELEILLPQNGKLRADAALLSDVGQERELNEDAGFIAHLQRAAHLDARDLDLYVVADGMGGHEGGEVASDLTLSSLQNRFDEYSREVNFGDNVAVRALLLQVIDAVNADVVALTETPRYRGTRAKPGATLCFALRIGARAFFGNVGDSRAYKFTPTHGLERVSKDHSYVQTLIDRGELTEEEAFTHPDGSIITAHIGYPKLKTRDVFLRLVSPGDKILIVSDGVTDMLRDAAIAPHLQQADSTAICRTLVDASNAAGGLDNITALCVTFS